MSYPLWQDAKGEGMPLNDITPHPIGASGIPHAFSVTVKVWEDDEDGQEVKSVDRTVVIAITIEDAIVHVVNLLNDCGFNRVVTKDDVISVNRLNDGDEGVFLTNLARDYIGDQYAPDIDSGNLDAQGEVQDGYGHYKGPGSPDWPDKSDSKAVDTEGTG